MNRSQARKYAVNLANLHNDWWAVLKLQKDAPIRKAPGWKGDYHTCRAAELWQYTDRLHAEGNVCELIELVCKHSLSACMHCEAELTGKGMTLIVDQCQRCKTMKVIKESYGQHTCPVCTSKWFNV